MTASHQRGDRSVAPGPLGIRVPARSSPETVRVTEACTACGACLATCPERALVRAPQRPQVVDSACTACWACIEICPAGAIVELGGHRPTPPSRRRSGATA